MAFKGKRGLVLRTTRPMSISGTKLAKGTRVKYMAPVDRDTLKVKVQDSAYPKLRGEHATVKYSDVTKVDRGRPSVEETVASKPTARKAPAKKAAARKRPAVKKASTTVDSTASADSTESAAE